MNVRMNRTVLIGDDNVFDPCASITEGDANSHMIEIVFDKAPGGIDLSGADFSVIWANGMFGLNSSGTSALSTSETTDGKIKLNWTIPAECSVHHGRVVFQVLAENAPVIWISGMRTIEVKPSLLHRVRREEVEEE